MNALATHVGDGRWVVETPRPVAEADKVFTVPSPSMMPAGMSAVWSHDGAWVAPVPGTVPGTAPSSGFGAPSMQVPSEAWFEGAGEFAEVPESDDHGGCGTNEAFEAAYLAAAAEASARGVIEPGERREALIDALMEEAAQAERAKFEAMVASGEVKVWEDDEDESRFDPQGRPFELPKRLWQRLEEDAATEDVTSSSTSSNPSPSPWLRPTPANPLVPPATWSVGEQLRRCGHAVPLYTWTTTKIQGPGGAKVDYSGDPARMKAEAETRVKAKLLTQMHAPPRTLGRATKLQMVDTEAGWAGLVTPVGTRKMSVIGWQAFTKLGKPHETKDDGSDRLHWPLAKAAPGGSGPQASSSTSLGTPAPTQGTPTPSVPPIPPTPLMFGAGVCDDGEVLPTFSGYTYALDIEPGGLNFTPIIAELVKTLHDGWWALERVQRYLPEERVLAWNDDRGASSAGSPSMEHHFGPYSKALLRELQKLLAEAAERWVLGFPRKTTAPTASFKVGVGSDGMIQPSTSPLRRRVQFRLSGKLSVCTSSSGIRRTDAAQRVYIDYCNTWVFRPLETKVRTLLEVSIGSITNGGALVDWLMERARAQGSSAPYPVARCDEERDRTPYCAPPGRFRTLRSDEGWVDELLRAGYWATYGAWRALADFAGDTPADMKSAWNEEMVVFGPTGAPRSPDEAVYDQSEVAEYETYGESAVGPSITYRAPKNLERRFQSFGYRRYNIILRALAALGKVFVREPAPSPLDLASGDSKDVYVGPAPLKVVLVDGSAGSNDDLFSLASESELRVSRGAQTAPRQQVMASLLRTLLTFVPDDEWEGAFSNTAGAGIGAASGGRQELSGWVTARYLWLGLCGVAVCPSGRMYRVPKPKILPKVVTKSVPAATGSLHDLQVATVVARHYGRSFFDSDFATTGNQPTSNEHSIGLWGGATEASYHPEQSLFAHLHRPYSAELLDELLLIWGELRDMLVDTGLPTTSGGPSALGTKTLGPYRVLQGSQPNGEGADWSAQSPRQIYVPISFAFQGRRRRMEILAQGFLEAAWHRLAPRTITTSTGSIRPAISQTTVHEMRRVAKWLAEYWENIGRCVPEFNAVFDPVARPALYQRVYPYGGDGTRVWDVHGTGYTADELDVWFQDAKLRIEQAAALIERAYRYLRLLELLPDGERQVMWTYGELDLKVWIRDVAKNAAPLMAAASSANISLPGDGEIPSMKWVRAQFEPFLIDKTKRDEFARIVTRRYRRCPSLRVWFGPYSPELLSYLLITYGILMRRFGLGFAHTRTHVSPLRFRLNLDASAVTSWHAVPGWIVLREKRLDDFARIERTIHEACHWLWFGSTRPFHKSSFVNQGLPRDVRKNECYDDTGDSTCYDLGGAFALHRVNRSTGSPYSLQNIDNFVTWTMSLYYNNSQFGIASVDDLASGTLAAWPYPRGVSDVWVPPPLLARISWSPREPVSGTPGSFDSECGAYSILAAIVGSTGGIDDAKADFC